MPTSHGRKHKIDLFCLSCGLAKHDNIVGPRKVFTKADIEKLIGIPYTYIFAGKHRGFWAWGCSIDKVTDERMIHKMSKYGYEDWVIDLSWLFAIVPHPVDDTLERIGR